MSRTVSTIEVQQVAYHRNGICGAPFYAVLFNDPDWGRMLATVFDEPSSRTPAGALVAVICLELIDTCGVTFGENSFRGDAYTPQLIEAIRAAGYDDI